MSEMKLIMESWRKYSRLDGDCGPLYLFEGRRVRKTSFSKALDSIGNSEKELDLLFEQWEKSLDYELKRLNEVDWKTLKEDPVLYLSTQIFRLWNKAKENILKYATTIIRGSQKLNAFAAKFEKKNPQIYQVGTTVAKVVTAAVALYVVQNVMGGADAMAGDMTQFGNVVADPDQLNAVADLLAQDDHEGLQKVAKLFRNMASQEGDQDINPHFRYKIQKFLVAVAEQDIEKLNSLVRSGGLPDAYTEIAEKAAEILADAQETSAPEAPEAREIPFGRGVSGPIGLDNILDHIEALSRGGDDIPPDQMKLLNFLANDTSPDKAEVAKRAAEILSKL